MENFVKNFFEIETINCKKENKLGNILELVEDEYLNLMLEKYKISKDDARNNLEAILKESIIRNFKNNLLGFTPLEHKSFYDLYNGIVEYTDENLYINLKKFTSLGLIFLFTTNEGQLFNYKIPDELMDVYEELLKIM
ncbi:MAG: hypothetical protein ACTJGH_05515 [Peptoniphilaceae bacterium]